MKCLIVDDEQLARELLKNFIGRLPQLELVKSCKNPLEALAYLQENPVDILFLDIQMPDLTGIELLKTLPHKPIVIITTAYQDYAIEGYQLNVTDYLLKPFPFNRFVQSVNRAQEWVKFKHAGEKLQENTPETYLTVHADHKIYKIPLVDIEFIEGMKEYVAYHTPERRILSLQSLKELTKRLPSTQFIRIHRSYIVAFDRIKAIDGNQVILTHKKLPIGRSYKEALLSRFSSGI